MIINNKFFSLQPYLVRNKFFVYKHFALNWLENSIRTLVVINFFRTSLYFTLYVSSVKRTRLVFSKSVIAILKPLTTVEGIFFKAGGIIKPKMWYTFFFRFLYNIPSKEVVFFIKNWPGQLNPFFSLIYKFKRLSKIYFLNSREFSHAKLKKTRSIKKKLKKKIYS
jgi:hypothetical protein